MFNCPVCQTAIFVTSAKDITCHLNLHKALLEIKYPIVCNQHSCRSSNATIWSYVRHFNNFHTADFDILTTNSSDPVSVNLSSQSQTVSQILLPTLDDSNFEMNENDLEFDGSFKNNEDISLEDIFSKLNTRLETETMNMIIDLRGRGNVPYNVSVDLMKFISRLITYVADDVCLAIEVELQPLKQLNDKRDSIDRIKENICGLPTIFSKMTSEYKIRKFYENHPGFVAPRPLALGHRFEMQTSTVDGACLSNIVSQQTIAQHVPIANTISSLVKNDPHFLNRISQTPIVKHGIYDCFQSGTRYREYATKSDGTVLFFQFFYDGLGITNGLNAGGGRKHNTGVFFYSFLNLPPRYNACLANLNLFALCNSNDIKSPVGKDAILGQIVSEINDLQSNGIEIETSEGKKKIYGCLAQFVGDNLGMNQMFNLVESFAGDYCCVLCYATKEEMQKFDKESDFKMRTRIDYEYDLSMLDKLPENQIHFRGIKAPCILNSLDNFHIMDNWCNDSMHTFIEGILPYCGGAVLHSISQLKPEVNVQQINLKTSLLFDSLIVGRANKPYPLKSILEPGLGFSPTQSAAQQLAFFQYLPLILSGLIKNEASLPYLELLLIIEEMVDIVFAPAFTDSLLSYFSTLVSSFLSKFKELYPNLSIRPKMHFTVHIASIVKKNGAPKNYWCMNFERLNGALKVPTHIMQNFKNPLATLSYRRQCAALNLLIEGKNNRDFISFPSQTTEILTESIFVVQNFALYANEFSTEYILTTDSVVVNGTNYRSDTMVFLGYGDYGYLFGRIEFVISENAEKPLLLTTLFETTEFDCRCHCFNVKPIIPTQLRLCTIHDLLDPLPLDLVTVHGGCSVRLHYHILSNMSI